MNVILNSMLQLSVGIYKNYRVLLIQFFILNNTNDLDFFAILQGQNAAVHCPDDFLMGLEKQESTF